MSEHHVTGFRKAKELYEAGLLWMKSPYAPCPMHVPPPMLEYTLSRDAHFWPPYYTQGTGWSFFIVLED